MSNIPGSLYIVATPIGNLDDISLRAKSVLREVDLILAEDTRHSRRLLDKLNIKTPVKSLHDFNEIKITSSMIERLKNNQSIAIISDAGTPLISDPGYRLVKHAHEENIRVIPIPGASALICALSAAGQATDRFVFEGYLPARQTAREKRLKVLKTEPRTLVIYESPHRIIPCIKDMITVFGKDRCITLAKELTKIHETIRKCNLGDLKTWLEQDPARQKGEFVLIIEGLKEELASANESRRILKILQKSLPPSKAAALAAEITGMSKNDLYKLAISSEENTR